MEKISSIVGSTNAKVDMSKERPVRSGAPSFGRPVSEATKTFEARDKIVEEKNKEFRATQANNSVLHEPLHHSGIIDKITLSFKGSPQNLIQNEIVDFSNQEGGPTIYADKGDAQSSTEGGSLSIYV